MVLYPAEDDIKDLILSDKISIACTIGKGQFEIANDTLAEGRRKVVDLLYPDSLDRDSMWIPAVLVTTNWNKNDCVFSPLETAKARKTPLLKPVNWMHSAGEDLDENLIIGTINKCVSIDDNCNILGDDTDWSTLDKFHIAVGMVVWKDYFPLLSEKIESSMNDAKMAVSMECLIRDFGYALRRVGSNDIALLDRTAENAGLTKRLRKFRGSGKVLIGGDEYAIGYWIKDFVFSGVGFVFNPANNESVILTEQPVYAGGQYKMAASIENFESDVETCVLNLEGETMNKTNTDKTVAGDEMDYAAELATAKAELATVKASLEQANKDKEAAAAENKNLAVELATVKATADTLKAAMDEQAKTFDFTKAELEKATVTLADIAKDNVAKDRVTKLAAFNSVNANTFKQVREMASETFDAVLDIAKNTFDATVAKHATKPQSVETAAVTTDTKEVAVDVIVSTDIVDNAKLADLAIQAREKAQVSENFSDLTKMFDQMLTNKR